MRTASMASVPCVGEPLYRPSDSISSTIDASKSKIHSLLHWRKHNSASFRSSTRSGHEMASTLSSSTEQPVRPSPASRTHSERSQSSVCDRPRSADNKVNRIRDRVIIDPPPLAQVYGQSILHADLETPTSFTEKSRPVTHGSKDQYPTGLMEDRIEVKRSHKRTESGESTCSTQGKMFFLVNGPYVLQYEGNSNGDALPEKILILDRDSVAIACDVVPGRPWVLQISKPHLSSTKSHGPSLRPSWSRITLRQPEDRRAANTLLLVFNDSEELYTWLFAIRKEIEGLGGIEYKPDGEDDQAWRDNLTQKYSQTSRLRSASQRASRTRKPSASVSRSSSNKRGDVINSTRVRCHSHQSSTSSKNTSTSLDRFRDSVASDGYSSTLATSCADSSASPISPVHETFLNIKSVTDHPTRDLSLRTYARRSDGVSRVSTSPRSPRSLLERRKLSVGSLNLVGPEDTKDRGRKFLLDLPPTISASPNDPPPPLTSSASDDVSASRETASSVANMERPRDQRLEDFKKNLTRHPSTAESNHSICRPKYSLFPACPPTETKEEPLAHPSMLLEHISIPKIVESHHDAKSHTYPGLDAKHHQSRSRTVTLSLRQHRVSALLGAGEFAYPQRSPAATDDMIMSNFGVARDVPSSSPLPEIQIPELIDLKMDLDFLRAPYRAPSKGRSPAAANRRTTSTRSASSARCETSTMLAKAPAGPPPVGPLPNVPLDSARFSRTSNRSSQQSQRQSQSKTNDQCDAEDAPMWQEGKYVDALTSSPKRADMQQEGWRRRRSRCSSMEVLPLFHNTPRKSRETTSGNEPQSGHRGP